MVDRFMKLFDGLNRAYGLYKLDHKSIAGKKNKGKAETKKAPVTPELWQKHLDGQAGIGIVPIQDGNTCSFGAIDIDIYENFDIIDLENKITALDWPLVVTRSKSGGAHIWVFMASPTEARLVRAKLKEVALALGHLTAEIFPKQDKMASKDDIGNWINMPYFEGDKTERYCIHNQKKLNMDQFLMFAEGMRLTLDDLQSIEVTNGEFSDAPPCLEVLCAQGFPSGSMNNALFDMGVYAKMKFQDDWQSKVFEYNQRFMGPGSSHEVQQVIKSIDRKKYIYRCSEAPIRE